MLGEHDCNHDNVSHFIIPTVTAISVVNIDSIFNNFI